MATKKPPCKQSGVLDPLFTESVQIDHLLSLVDLKASIYFFTKNQVDHDNYITSPEYIY